MEGRQSSRGFKKIPQLNARSPITVAGFFWSDLTDDPEWDIGRLEEGGEVTPSTLIPGVWSFVVYNSW